MKMHSVSFAILHTISQLKRRIKSQRTSIDRKRSVFTLMAYNGIVQCRKSTRCFDLLFFRSVFITVIVFIVRSIKIRIDTHQEIERERERVKKNTPHSLAGIAQSFHASMSAMMTKMRINREISTCVHLELSHRKITKKMEAKQ